MFEEVCIASPDDDRLLEVVDALAYYGTVDVEATSGTVVRLCKIFGANNVISLIDSGNLRLLYTKHSYAIQSETNPVPTHQFVSFFLSKDVDGKKIKHPGGAIELALKRAFPGDPTMGRVARDFADRVITRPYYPEIEKLSAGDIRDAEYRDRAISAVINELVPGTVDPSTFKTEFTDLGDRFLVPLPLDYARLNEAFHRTTSPEEASVSPAYILSHLITARQHLSLGAERSADMWLPPASAALINLRMNSLAGRIEGGARGISHFSDIVFNGRSFGKAISSGSRSPAELVAFVQSSETQEMKKWVASLPPDASLIEEYVKKNESKGVMSTLPARLAKVSFFTGLGLAVDAAIGSPGLVAGAAALAIGGTDEFLASKLRLGWRPNSWSQNARSFLGEGD